MGRSKSRFGFSSSGPDFASPADFTRSELVFAMLPPNPSQSANNMGVTLFPSLGDRDTRSGSEVAMSLYKCTPELVGSVI